MPKTKWTFKTMLVDTFISSLNNCTIKIKATKTCLVAVLSPKLPQVPENQTSKATHSKGKP